MVEAEQSDVEVMRESAGGAAPVVQKEHVSLGYATDVDLPGLRCWIRIPNKFQHRKIQKTAIAARARKITEYRKPDSDAAVTLQASADYMMDEGVEQIRQWLISQHRPEATLDASLQLEIGEERWGEIDEQRERYQQMLRMGDTRGDEFLALEEILMQYAGSLEELTNEKLQPFEVKYSTMTELELRNKVERALIKADADDEFTNVYNQWQIFYGTRKHTDHNKYFFKNFDQVMEADDHIIESLISQFAVLDALKAGEIKKALAETDSLAISDTSANSEAGETDGPKESSEPTTSPTPSSKPST